MKLTEEKLTRRPRKYFPEDVNINEWEKVEAVLNEALEAKIESSEELLQLMEKYDEYSTIIGQKMAQMYINMTCYADNEEYRKEFNDYYSNIIAKIQPYGFKISKKFYESPHMAELDDKEYGHMKQIIANGIELFREKNVPLSTKEVELKNRYGEIVGALTVEYEGEEYTLAQLSKYLLESDRNVREKVWRLRLDRIQKEQEKLDKLYDELLELRVQQAKNADFENYRDYKHQAMGRFSYTPEDLYQFHNAVEKVVIPFLREQTEKRRKKLGVESVRPWDTAVDLDGIILKPFENVDELVQKGIKVLHSVDPEFGINLTKMYNTGLLDLENRKGKAPGGYNYPLRELGSSFIFMNAVGLHGDMTTLLHEAGHAMHAAATKDIKISEYKGYPSEIAELASMAMEFLTMDYWNEYYPNAVDYKKGRKDQLFGALSFLPWCMVVDAFQHWIYTNPNHTAKERSDYFVQLSERFNTGVNWEGLEAARRASWMFQLHIFEVPFYYIEYGMAQLGALSVYKNYREKGHKAIDDYKNFLALGYSKPVNELYEAAGIEFSFTEEHLQSLVDFVRQELEELED